ncbi:MAG: hypothetical protein K5666_02615, partial [Bacilli bacterium]|nr:hypothetical protein [Bacilli bacterium]
SDSNQKNKDHQVVLVYKDKEVTDSNSIKDIKHSLNDLRYEVTFNYDDKGYINKIVVEEIS